MPAPVTKPIIVECPRCNEAAERSLGENRCGLCECRFVVRVGGQVFSPEHSKRIANVGTAPPMPVAIKTVDFQTATNLINESGLNSLQGRIAETIAAQREQCAKIAETCGVEGDNWRRDIAAAIRNLKSE